MKKKKNRHRRRRCCCRLCYGALLGLCAVHAGLMWIVFWQSETFIPYLPPRALRGLSTVPQQEKNSVIMPVVGFEEPWAFYHSSKHGEVKNLSIQVANSVSGCEPKFFVHATNNDNKNNSSIIDKGQQSFLFKPSQRFHALYEWIAYHTSELLAFHRVPPVRPVALSRHQIWQAVQQQQQLDSSSFIMHWFKCRMEFTKAAAEWLPRNSTHPPSPPTTNHPYDIVIGTVQLLVPGVRQRAELDRAMNRKLFQGYLDRHQTISPFVQRERDTRRLFDSLLGNKDRYNNDFVLEQQQQDGNNHTSSSSRLLLYLDNTFLFKQAAVEAPWYCRFYHQVVERLRTTTDLQGALAHHMATQDTDSQALVQSWTRQKLLGARRDLQPMFYLNERRTAVLQHVDACLERHGFDHVFVHE